MSDIIQLRANLKKAVKLLREAGEEHSKAVKISMQKRIVFEKKYATMYLASDEKKKLDDRKEQAKLDCFPEYEQMELAEAEVDALRENIRVLSNALNGLQTQARLLTLDYQVGEKYD